jgi:DNA ligase (NAD+)
MSQPHHPVGDIESWSREHLEREIQRHNKLYWEQQSPEISDYDYDRLVVRLQQIAPDSPVLVDLGESAESLGEPVQHPVPMLSLDKCYGEEDLNDWASKIRGDFVIMPKLDGIACALRYDGKGRLFQAATRGTGFVGDDVTVNARAIKSIAQKVDHPNVEVRGEVYMRLSVFEKFKDRFSNPRNLTAGAMKQKDASRSASYGLSFFAYDVLGADLRTEVQKFRWLGEQGFEPIPLIHAKHGELQEGYEQFAAQRPTLDYEIDGVVFRANEVSEQSRLGNTAHHPRYALAYKFQGESGRTTLENLEWSVSRTGAITPVALVTPVQLSGAMVSRASLHHAGYVGLLGLTERCEVLVTRRGGVIPNVEKVLTQGTGGPFRIPEHCPACGQPTEMHDDFLFCSGPSQCRAALLGEIEHYCAVTEMLGFGERVLSELWDQKLIRTPVDLYRLTVAQLESLDRVGTKLATKLVAQVDSRRTLPLDVFLRALGVPELGNHVSALLARQFGTLETVRKLTVEELANVHSVGEVIAKSVVEGLRERSGLIDGLLQFVTIQPPRDVVTQGPLKGLSFVFTGTLQAMDRKVAQTEVRKLGAETPSSVSAGLSYLVVGEERDNAKSSKQKAAEKHQAQGAPLQVVNEEQFLHLLERARQGHAPPAARAEGG